MLLDEACSNLLALPTPAVPVGARTEAHINNALTAGQMRLDPPLQAEMSAWE